MNGQSETWSPEGSKHVAIAKPYSGLGKRQCTIQPTIGACGKLMLCAIIFLRAGKRIPKMEKVYDTTFAWIFSCRNAWAESEVCMSWAKNCFCDSLTQGRDGVCAEESLLTLDSLEEQKRGTFKADMNKCNSPSWFYPGGCQDALQPIDAGLGVLIKGEFGEELDLWLESRDNLER